MTSSRRRWLISLLAALVCIAVPAGASADVGAAFGSPSLIDSATPFAAAWAPGDISCGSASTCVAFEAAASGPLEVSTTTSAGASLPPSWSTPAPVGVNGFSPAGLTCFSASDCVSVGLDSQTDTGEAIASTDGGSTWTVLSALSTSSPTQALACTTSGVCVAVDSNGNAFYGAVSGGAWTESTTSLASLASGLTFAQPSASCTGSACVVTTFIDKAKTNKVAFLTTADITAASPSWTVESIADGENTPTGVSCTPSGTCLAVDTGGNAFVSTDAGSTWAPHTVNKNERMSAVSCADAPSGGPTCVIAGGEDTYIATGISSGDLQFTPAYLTFGSLASLACPSVAWCTGGVQGSSELGYGQIVLTPGQSPPASATWSDGQVSGVNPLTAVACAASGGDCAAADLSGRVLVSRDGGTSWSTPTLPSSSTSPVTGLSCTTDGMCLAVEGGEAFTATGLGGSGTVSWSGGTSLGEPSGANVDGASCASEQLCVAVDSAGDAVVSTEPGGADPSWLSVTTGASSLRSISCPSTSLCVAGDGTGDVWYSTTPGANVGWSGPDSIDGQAITAIDCQPDGSCVAGDKGGQVLDSPDVTQGAGSWSAPAPTGVSAPVLSLACTESDGGMCAAATGTVGSGGSPVVGPSDVASEDWSTVSGAPTDLTGVACASAQSCVWTDPSGDATASTLGTGSVALSTSGLSFATTALNATTPAQSVTVTNAGIGTLSISGWSLTGAGSASFPVIGDTCSGTSLPAGQSCALTVRFAPAATGAQVASLQIESDDPSSPATVALSGTGAPAATSSTPGAPVTHHRSGPVTGRARFTRAAVTGTLIDAIVLCEGRSGARCATRLRLTAREHLRGQRLVSVSDARRKGVSVKIRPVTLASGSVTLTASRGRVVHLTLNRTGLRLLHQLHKLHATLTATQTVGGKTVTRRRFHLVFASPRRR